MAAMRFSTSSPGWLILAACFAFTAYSSLVMSPEPLGPIEATSRLQAESLARDGDFTYDERDRSRFADKHWHDREAKAMVSRAGERLRYQGGAPYAIALAPFVRLAPQRGPYLLNLMILGGVALLLVKRIRLDSPISAPYWTAGLVFATPVFAYTRAAWPDLLTAALVVGAYLLTGDRAPEPTPGTKVPRGSGPIGVVRDAKTESPADGSRRGLRIVAGKAATPKPDGGRPAGSRWLGVGFLTALAVLQEPLSLVFLVVFLWIGRRDRAEAKWAFALGGFAATLLVAWFAGESLLGSGGPWQAEAGLAVRSGDSIEDIMDWTARLESAEPSGPVFDPRLWLWNAAYTLGGRTVGIGVPFLALWGFAVAGVARRRSLWCALGLAAVLALVFAPFNFFGGPEALGNRRLLPALVLCFFAVRAARPLWPSLVAAVLGALVVAPLWLAPTTHPLRLRAGLVVTPIADRLLFETTQRHAPVSGEVVTRLLLVRPMNDAIEPATGGSQFVLRGGRRGKLMVAAAEPLESVDLEFGPTSGSELVLEDTEVDNLLFRPDGGVTFRLAVGDARIRHRMWGRDAVHDVYLLEFSMPPGEGRDQPFSVSAKRSDV